jgi:hypothetical protein
MMKISLDKNRISIVHLMAKLIKYGGADDLKCKGSANQRVYSASPMILIEWMEQSQITPWLKAARGHHFLRHPARYVTTMETCAFASRLRCKHQ